MDYDVDFKKVESDYRAAFGHWVAEMGSLQKLSAGESASTEPEIKARVEAAEAVYRETRDQLVGLARGPHYCAE